MIIDISSFEVGGSNHIHCTKNKKLINVFLKQILEIIIFAIDFTKIYIRMLPNKSFLTEYV